MISIILFILAGTALLWEMSLVGMGIAMLSSGKFTNVKIPSWPGILALVFAIAGVILL